MLKEWLCQSLEDKEKEMLCFISPSLSIIFRPNELIEIHEDKGSFHKVIHKVKEFGHLILDFAPKWLTKATTHVHS